MEAKRSGVKEIVLVINLDLRFIAVMKYYYRVVLKSTPESRNIFDGLFLLY